MSMKHEEHDRIANSSSFYREVQQMRRTREIMSLLDDALRVFVVGLILIGVIYILKRAFW